jgi:Xaa-Pro aminopeptidase
VVVVTTSQPSAASLGTTSQVSAASLGTADNIAGQLDRRRRAVADAWNLGDEVVLIGAGERVPVPGRGDRMYPFRSHSEYLYLTDRERPGGVLAFDPHDGWVDFVTAVTREERLWEGVTDAQEGRPTLELEGWLGERRGRPLACLGAPVAAVAGDDSLATELRYALNQVRRQKDEFELHRMRVAQRATAAGFAAIEPLLRPGRTERAVQIELEAEFFRNGADFLAFDTIVGGGPNAAVLHFPPGQRPFQAGDLILIDAGGEYRGYASDMTRTYAASGTFTPEQSELYAIVRSAGFAATARCTSGTEWRDVHRTAALVIAQGLVDFGLLRGEPESLVERGAQSIFFPHGIGHMVGLGIRDAGEVLKGRPQGGDEFPRLRMDLPLLVGHVVTVEPGIYLVPALLHDAEFRERYRDAVAWDRAESMLDFGGIRIEDNVLVTDDGPKVLTGDVPVHQ